MLRRIEVPCGLVQFGVLRFSGERKISTRTRGGCVAFGIRIGEAKSVAKLLAHSDVAMASRARLRCRLKLSEVNEPQ